MEQSNVKFTGVMSALVSCIDENEQVMEDSMRRLMRWHLKEGLSGFYLTGGIDEEAVPESAEPGRRGVQSAACEQNNARLLRPKL